MRRCPQGAKAQCGGPGAAFFDSTFLNARAARDAGTSNRRHGQPKQLRVSSMTKCVTYADERHVCEATSCSATTSPLRPYSHGRGAVRDVRPGPGIKFGLQAHAFAGVINDENVING